MEGILSATHTFPMISLEPEKDAAVDEAADSNRHVSTRTVPVFYTAGSAQPATSQVTNTISFVSRPRNRGNQNVSIGKSIVVEGELHASEDVAIEGRVEGRITLKQHALKIGPSGRVRAQVSAKSVVVLGEVAGDIEAAERISIGNGGTVNGDIKAPRVAIAEGATFSGSIDMQPGQRPNRTRSKSRRPEPRKPRSSARVGSA